jgi:hypothetical protein
MFYRFRKYKTGFFSIILFIAFVPLAYVAPKLLSVSYQAASLSEAPAVSSLPSSEKNTDEPEGIAVVHLQTPKPLKAIYMTGCVASTPSFRDSVIRLIKETELNAVVIDIKDYTGTLSFKPTGQDLLHAWESARCGTLEMKEIIHSLHLDDIYVIGRITVFQDPHMASRRKDLAVQKLSDKSVWKDFKGLSFTDPAAKEIWDYHVAISKEAYSIGFDELNYDYIRFPSDGPMSDIYFPVSINRSKPDVLESFFKYLHDNIKNLGVVISADLFGMTTTNTDDLNIGQVLERALPYFDYIAPMVYPSHYPPNWHGFGNPNHYPYEVVNISMREAVRRSQSTETSVKTLYNEPIYNEVTQYDQANGVNTVESIFSGLYGKSSYEPNAIRPWLQDFNYGGNYGPEEIKAQIQATYDAGLSSWMFWDPANKYDSLRQVLKE